MFANLLRSLLTIISESEYECSGSLLIVCMFKFQIITFFYLTPNSHAISCTLAYTVFIFKLLIPVTMHVLDIVIKMIHRYDSTCDSVHNNKTNIFFFLFSMCKQIPLYFLYVFISMCSPFFASLDGSFKGVTACGINLD